MVIEITKKPKQNILGNGISKGTKHNQVIRSQTFRYYYTSHFDEFILNESVNQDYEGLESNKLLKRNRNILKGGRSKRAKHMDIHTAPTIEQLQDKDYMADWFAATQHFFDKSLQDVQDGKEKIGLFLERKKRDVSCSLSEHKDT
ncbi:hypothetical protein CLU79DRAFT_153374 [Phycomyces nitens]|nr:hypothetical protein CLU79DRAFT_153374 [Phycomyces nitens]